MTENERKFSNRGETGQSEGTTPGGGQVQPTVPSSLRGKAVSVAGGADATDEGIACGAGSSVRHVESQAGVLILQSLLSVDDIGIVAGFRRPEGRLGGTGSLPTRVEPRLGKPPVPSRVAGADIVPRNKTRVQPMQRIQVIDSHTGGEPTRVVIDGGPGLGGGPVYQRLAVLRDRHDWLRTSLVNEPRGSDAMVGALIEPPVDPECVAAVIFFNNVGYLGMCGHGAMGVITTLAHLGRIQPGVHRLETAVGQVKAQFHDDGRVSIENVPCYRYRARVQVEIPGPGTIAGDVAWGGNWFFLVSEHGQTLDLAHVRSLIDYTSLLVTTLRDNGIRGNDGAEIDHIELFGPPSDTSIADSRNFVLCPGRAYDRSPCGTGTSAKLACLAAEDRLQPGQPWRQQSIVGSVFEASYRRDGERIVPTVTGRASVNAEVSVVLDPRDPFTHGIR